MVEVSMKEMLEAGVHFGHQTQRWNPRMKPYIYGARNGIHIIDLEKTVKMCEGACGYVEKTVSEGGELLFVGTKKQAQAIVEESAKKCGMPYVTNRWLGGTLTNFRTIKASIDRLKELERKKNEGGLEGLTKKEKLNVEREIEKLLKVLGGIREMNQLPSALFLIDPTKEHIAQAEAMRLGIPVIALADTNCNPEGIDYLIPGNDDALKSIRYFSERIGLSCQEGLNRRDAVIRERMEKEAGAEGSPGSSIREEVIGGKGKAYVSHPDRAEEPAKEVKP